jgi:hypothetical protein
MKNPRLCRGIFIVPRGWKNRKSGGKNLGPKILLKSPVGPCPFKKIFYTIYLIDSYMEAICKPNI